jgi:hypothetical protein|tara:strand:- start:69 stop:494 length:426 start_codon:yes stop_codon:yes gene_type:complete
MDDRLPCRCRRFRNAKGRGERLRVALDEEYDQCFESTWNLNHRAIITACRNTVVTIALCTILPLAHDAVRATLRDTHVVVDAVAFRFCLHLKDTWFSIDNHELTTLCKLLESTRKQKIHQWTQSKWPDEDSPKSVTETSCS